MILTFNELPQAVSQLHEKLLNIEQLLIEKQKPQQPDELLTETEAEALLQISRVTLKKWRDDGKLPYYRYGSRIRYKRAELIDAAEKPLLQAYCKLHKNKGGAAL
jgi:excisionase family DNA binding protein